MDFSRNDTQAAVAEAVAGALRDAAPAEELLTALPSRSIDDAGYDEKLWRSFAGSGLLDLALPAALGGDELTVADVAVVLEETGKAGAVVPAMETLGFGIAPIVALGTGEQQAELLGDMGSGPILTAACGEAREPMTTDPSTRLENGKLHGAVTGVRYAAQARTILVPTLGGIAAVSPQAEGVEVSPALGSLGVPEYAVSFDGAEVQAVLTGTGGAPAAELPEAEGRALVDRFRALQLAAITASADGFLSGALGMTAEYLKNREQFGRSLGAFQAVQQELADAYVVAQNMHNLAVSLNWRIAQGLYGSSDRYATDGDIAAWWLASEGPRAMQVLHHLHGGVGVDITYPMFRYSSAVSDLARFVGGAELQLEKIAAAEIDPARLPRWSRKGRRTSTSPSRSARCRPSCASTSAR